MALSTHQTFLVILFTLLVEKGVGQWKRPSREMIEQDLKLYKKISENIKRELETFYGEYPEAPLNDYFLEEIDYIQNKIEKMGSNMKEEERKEIHISRLSASKDENHDSTLRKLVPSDSKFASQKNSMESYITNSRWPKFEDMLLDIGKRYDWKNDRWIKVKDKLAYREKLKPNDVSKTIYHQKHNFKYRIVKLNRAKSKRNIVIAVTAVR